MTEVTPPRENTRFSRFFNFTVLRTPSIALRLVVMAVVLGMMLLLNKTLLGGIMFEGAAVLMCLLPPPFVIPVFADAPEERTQIASALSALTLVSIILFAVYSVILSLA